MNAFTSVASELGEQAAAYAPRVEAGAGRLLAALRPTVALAVPLLRRLNWRTIGFGVVAGAAGYLVYSLLRKGGPPPAAHKPPELNRWETDGGMVPTTAGPASARPVDRHGDVGSGAGDPPLNS